jgi:hypothetical protein
MIEFENLVYLDVQKTGSTFVIRFLQRFVASPLITSLPGKPLEQRKDGALHLISCRHPLYQYLSLYSYGCTGKGGLRNRDDTTDFAHLYDGTPDGLAQWLALMLSPKKSDNELFGFQTARFLKMALPNYRKVLGRDPNKDDIREKLSRFGMMDVVLKQETLNDDLLKLVEGEYCHLFKNRRRVQSYLAKTPRRNTSPKLDIDPSALSADVLSTLRAREWLFFEALGYV